MNTNKTKILEAAQAEESSVTPVERQQLITEISSLKE